MWTIISPMLNTYDIKLHTQKYEDDFFADIIVQ